MSLKPQARFLKLFSFLATALPSPLVVPLLALIGLAIPVGLATSALGVAQGFGRLTEIKATVICIEDCAASPPFELIAGGALVSLVGLYACALLFAYLRAIKRTYAAT